MASESVTIIIWKEEKRKIKEAEMALEEMSELVLCKMIDDHVKK